MKRSVLGIIVAVVAIGAIAGVIMANNQNKNSNQPATTTSNSMDGMDHSAGNNSMDSEEEPAAENAVNIVDFSFNPETLTVKKGTTVTWTNKDEARHDVTPDDPSEAFKGSELLGQGETYSFTFDTVGTYSYYCSPHPYMKASVKVVE